jgi:peroxiredoxin
MMLQLIPKNEAKMAPDFVVEDSKQNTIKLADFRAKSNVILVFNRGFF